MQAITIKEVAEIVGGQLINEAEGQVKSVVIDSRNVKEDTMFAAFPGENVDGHDYIDMAFENGASCCIGNRVPEGETRPVIVVEDVQKALKELATYHRNRLHIPIVGITGSVGKTTTKEMISAVLSSRYKVLKTEKNLNNELGVPLTLFQIEEDHEAAVIEMGISDFKEMTRLAQMVQPDIGVFTVIGHSHLENLKNREGVLWAKTEMIKYMQPDGVMIANGDDDLLFTYPAERDKITYGRYPRCDVHALNLKMEADKTTCDVTDGERWIHVTVNAYGEHIIYALLAAVTVGIRLGLSDEEIQQGLLSYETVGRRSSVIETGKLTLIDDCYNANPDSVKSGIDSMKNLKGRYVAILGDMLELGDNSDQLHYGVGVHAANHGIDLLLTVGERSQTTAKAAQKLGVTAKSFMDNASLIQELPDLLKEGDVVLVKASHSMHFEEISEFVRGL